MWWKEKPFDILLRDTWKMWPGYRFSSELDVPKESGGLFGILNICHEMSGIDLEKKILYKVIPLQTLSHLGYDFCIRANMQGQD